MKFRFFLALVCGLISTGLPLTAANRIDGIWYGVYTSTYSPNPTQEVFIFQSSGNQVTGAYLSQSGSAGILSGIIKGNRVELAVSQPVEGCPKPATGKLEMVLSGDTMSYSFTSDSCQGTDNGSGHGMHVKGPYRPAPPSSSIAGFWEGVYTSTDSPQPTRETLYFQAGDHDEVTGIYVSHSGATGILTGIQARPNFLLRDNVPDPRCPEHGTFNGNLVSGTAMVYSFDGIDCKGNRDKGMGTARKFIP